MSLEQAIKDLTVAVLAQTAALGGIALIDRTPAPAATPAAGKKADTKKPTDKKPEAPPAGAPAANDDAGDAGEVKLDYVKNVQTPLYALAKAKGRDVAAKVLTDFKAAQKLGDEVKTAKDLPEATWPAYIAELAKAAA